MANIHENCSKFSSPVAKRSRRSRSSSREQKRGHRRSLSPSRDPRRARAPSRGRSPEQRSKRRSSSRERTKTDFKADSSRDTESASPCISTSGGRPVQAVTPHDASHRAIIDRLGTVAGPSTATKGEFLLN